MQISYTVLMSLVIAIVVGVLILLALQNIGVVH